MERCYIINASLIAHLTGTCTCTRNYNYVYDTARVNSLDIIIVQYNIATKHVCTVTNVAVVEHK